MAATTDSRDHIVTTATDRNPHPDADTRLHVQCTILGTNCTVPDYQALRTLRNHARAEFKSILTESDQILTLSPPHVPKLETSLKYRLQTRMTLTKLDSRILDLIEEDTEEEVEEADRYTHCLFRTKALLNPRPNCIRTEQPSKIGSRFFFSNWP